MVSVKQCVVIFVVSLCISSSIFVDSRRIRKHRRRDSRHKGRLPQNRYRHEDSKRSRHQDCVDCGREFQDEADDEGKQYHTERQKTKTRRRKTDSKNVAGKGSSSYIWNNLFNSMSETLWGSGDGNKEEKAPVAASRRKNGRIGRRKPSKNDGGRKDDAGDVEDRRRNKPDVSSEMYDRFRNAPKARGHGASVKERDRGQVQSHQRDAYDGDGDDDDDDDDDKDDDDGDGSDVIYKQSKKRNRHRGRNNRRKLKDRRQERERNYQKVAKRLRKGSQLEVRGKTMSPSQSKQRDGHGKMEVLSPKKDLLQRDKMYKKKKKNKRKNKSHGRKQSMKEDFVSLVSRKSKKSKLKKKNNDKKTGQSDESYLYPLVKAELHKVDEVDIQRKRKQRKNKKDGGKDEKDFEPSSMSVNSKKKVRTRKKDKDDKLERIQKSRRRGKKDSMERNRGKMSRKKTTGRRRSKSKGGDKSLAKAHITTKKPLMSKDGDAEKDEKTQYKEKNMKRPSSSGRRRKGRRRKKGRKRKDPLAKKTTDITTKESKKRKNSKKNTDIQSDNGKLRSGRKDARKSGRRRKKGNKPESEKAKKVKGKSSVNKAFSVFVDAQTAHNNKQNSDRPLSKSEAEKQVEALTDEQLVYALKVAEKRFKRTDRRIKRKLTALKEMTMRHLDALESLEMSLDQRAFPSNPMANPELYNGSSSPNAVNRVSFYHPEEEISSSQTSYDIKSDAKSFLEFASRTSRKMSKFFPGQSASSEGDENLEISKQNPTRDRFTPDSDELSASEEDDIDNTDQESSLNGSQRKSNRKSGRRRKKQRGEKKGGSKNNGGNTSSSVSDTFESKNVQQERNGRQRGNTFRFPSRNSNTQDRDRAFSRFLSKIQRGRSQGGRGRGDRRRDRYPNTRDRQKTRQIQMVLPRLSRSVREITRRLYHILNPFTTNIKLSDSYYHAIFNTTRYDVLSGAREILKDINQANDDVYDAVMRSSNLTRSIYAKARGKRALEKGGAPNTEPPPRVMESKVKMRNFRPYLEKLKVVQERAKSHTQDLHMMEMKSRELKSRRVQVYERFLENYDHQAFSHLFDNLRGTISILNNGLQKSFPLKQLHKSKKYVKAVQNYVTTAKHLLTNSSSIYRNGMRKLTESERLIRDIKRSKGDMRRKRMLSDSPGPGLTTRQFRRLEVLVVKTKKHAQRLDREMFHLQRVIGAAVLNAKIALQKSDRGSRARGHVNVDLSSLESVHQNAIMALDRLRKFIGGQREITMASLKGCKSGNLESDDEDFGCQVEGSGVEGSGDMTFVDSEFNGEDDFTFDGTVEEEVVPVSRPSPLQALGRELKGFTAALLSTSRHQDDKAQVVRRSLQELKDKWEVNEEESAATDLRANFKTLYTEGVAAAERNSTEIKAKIEAINKKLDELKEIDFEELKDKARLAIEAARKNIKHGGENESEYYDDDEDTGSEVDETDDGDESDKSGDPIQFGITDLLTAGETIGANRDSIKNLQTLAVDTIDKSNGRLQLLRGNITQLWEKVKVAKNLLNSMQLSIMKEGKRPIVSTALSDDLRSTKSLTTSFSLCIKPQTLDGTLLYSVGNNSLSYALQLSDGQLSALVYGDDNEELTDVTLDDKLEEDKWHTISLQRVGQKLNLTAVSEDKVLTESTEVEDMPEHQAAPSVSYIGGIPENMNVDSDGPWEGCVGELLVNDKSMDLFAPTMEGNSSSLCTEHCASRSQKLSWIFDGGGFVHYSLDPWQSIESLSLQFRSKQSHAAILSAALERRRFHLLVTLKGGAVQIESTTQTENVVLLSLNNSFNDGKSHTLKIFFRDRGVYPDLDGDTAAFSVENSRPTILKDLRDGILLGGFVSKENFIGNLYRPLIGCASVSSVNDVPLMYDGITQSHNVYHGRCTMRQPWQSCVHFPDTSQPLALGELANSNKISVQVLRNSTGPLLLYVKEDSFEIELVLTEDGIDAKSSDSEGELIRAEDYQPDELFDVITLEDKGKKVIVTAFGESVSFSYGSWYAAADLSLPHTVEIGQTLDGADRLFKLSIAEFVIGGEFYDLAKHNSTHTLKACEVPDSYLNSNFPTPASKE